MSDLLLLSSALGVALLGSGHCFGMCGPIAALSGRDRLFTYQIGRGLGYIGLGTLFGFFGKGFFSFVERHPEFEIFALVSVFVFLLLQWVSALSGRWDASRLSGAYRKFYTRFLAPLSQFLVKRGRGFGMGLGSAFLPCGFFIYFGSVAAASGSPSRGALLFLMLWLGSLPALLSASVGFHALQRRLKNPLYRNAFLGLILLVGVFSLGARFEKAHARGESPHSQLPMICGK